MTETARTARLLWELRRGTRGRPGALRDLRDGLLRQAVDHAAHRIPFYRRLWTATGVDLDRVRSLDDLPRLPIIAAEQVRAAAASGELLTDAPGAALGPRFSTSGSSGAPLEVVRGAVEARLWRVAGLRMQLEHGFRWTDTTLQFDAAPGPAHPLQRFGVAPTVWIPPQLSLDEQVDRLAAAHARIVIGHVTILRRIARLVSARRVPLTPPKAVFSMAEVLDDDSRATIGAAFGIEPCDVYGITEVGFIAWQCRPRAALHVNAELLAVEILREDGAAARPGELGRVVVTDLRGRTMPLLRYDTGDLAAAAGPCDCGRTLPTMGPVEGRARHVIRTADGRVLTQRAVMNHLAGTLRMGGYRLRRHPDGRFVLEVTPRGFAAGAGDADARRALRALLGDVDLVVEHVDDLPEVWKTYAVLQADGSPPVSPPEAR